VSVYYVLDTSVYIDPDRVDLGSFGERIPVLTAVGGGELASGLQLGGPDQQEQRERLFREALTDYEVLAYGVEEPESYGVLATSSAPPAATAASTCRSRRPQARPGFRC